ncbi:MAG: aminotransferase class I/II-fold pyridoxal phosphate-dependent enzyme [Bacteroidetes bacterium]|nr:aminotransferase class I/II-fold pyridoxal phosphate-dependent enzyme [Bacteroidota bacterium]
MKKFDPSVAIHDYLVFGEFGDVNPSITDSSTFTFLSTDKMEEVFEHEIEGCFLYSRHWNPINKYLSDALARFENTESAQVTASGMGAINCVIMQLCGMGDEIVSSHTIYGGTYALFKNFLPKFGIKVKFVDITDLNQVKKAMTDKTKVVYCETISNPLLEIANIPELSKIAKSKGAKLVVDNTFAPMIVTPKRLGADVVIHSMTKYINGTSDCVAGCICSTHEFISKLNDVNSGASMLLGTVLDSFRAASIQKNLHTLHIRMKKHSENAMYIAKEFVKLGLDTYYPGLPSHRGHKLLKSIMNDNYGFSGMVAIDVKTEKKANKLMEMMQNEKVGYLAVSLGYFKTLFSAPSHSTSSEIPEEEQAKIGLGKGLVRFSIGLDNNIEEMFGRIKKCLKKLNIV